MNCKDISRILDEHEPGELSTAETDALDAHVLRCVDCARQLRASEGMIAFRSEVPPLPAALEERARNLRKRAESKAALGRTRRPVIIGSLLLLGAAATMYAAVPWGDAGTAKQ